LAADFRTLACAANPLASNKKKFRNRIGETSIAAIKLAGDRIIRTHIGKFIKPASINIKETAIKCPTVAA